MNPTTEIAFILDRSGSMRSIQETAIQSFNQFLTEQREVGNDARFTLVLFNHEYHVPCPAVPIAEVVDLDTTTFVPCGNTALLDALGRTIDELGQRLAAMPEAARPKQVIVAVMTDGFENASRSFSRAEIARKIQHQKSVYNWQFFFLGADQDAISHAESLNIEGAHALSFAGSAAGYVMASGVMSRKASALRKMSACQRLTVQEVADLDAGLGLLADQVDPEGKGKI